MEDPLPPPVDDPEEKNGDEDEHLVEDSRGCLQEDDGPGEEEYGLHVKDYEQDGEDVVADLDLGPDIRSGWYAAFVRGLLESRGTLGRDQEGGQEHREDGRDSNPRDQKNHSPVYRVAFGQIVT